MPDGWHWHGWYWHEAFDTEANNSFVESYEEEYGNPPAMQPPSSYEAIYAYKQVIESVGTNSDDIVGELEGMTYDGVRGEVTIDADSPPSQCACRWRGLDVQRRPRSSHTGTSPNLRTRRRGDPIAA